MAAYPANGSGTVPGVTTGGMLPGVRSWRVRCFWRWQAWRLRKAHSHEASHCVSLYDSMQALQRCGYVDDFCLLHRQLLRESLLLGPDAPAAFARRLARELHDHCVLALLGAPDGSPAGYAWARCGRLADALHHYQRVQALSHLSSEDWAAFERRAAALAGDTAVLAINGIGLNSHYRKGFAPLKQLLRPLLELAERHGAAHAVWWAPRGSALHAMSLGFGARTMLETSRVVGFVLADMRPLMRVFAALPASGIADLLGRVAPARPPSHPPARNPPQLRAVPKPRRGGEAAA